MNIIMLSQDAARWLSEAYEFSVIENEEGFAVESEPEDFQFTPAEIVLLAVAHGYRKAPRTAILAAVEELYR